MFDSFVARPVKSIIVHDKSVFISTGLMHFMTSGSIVEITGIKGKVIFKSDSYRKNRKGKNDDEMVEGEYIGPTAYNENEGCIYFYSQNGIFKGNPKKNLSTIENWTKVFKPKLQWSNGQPDAVGSPMNVLKMEFTKSGRLVFFSQLNGIGIFDGKTLIMIQ